MVRVERVHWIAYGEIHLLERAGAGRLTRLGAADGRVAGGGRLPLWFVGLGPCLRSRSPSPRGPGRRVLWICGGRWRGHRRRRLAAARRDLPAFRDVNATMRSSGNLLCERAAGRLASASALVRANGGNPAEPPRSRPGVWMGAPSPPRCSWPRSPAVRHVPARVASGDGAAAADFAPRRGGDRRARPHCRRSASLSRFPTAARGRLRTEARALSSAGATWTVGHWGWQWYAAQEGMREYEPGKSRLQPATSSSCPGRSTGSRSHRRTLRFSTRSARSPCAATPWTWWNGHPAGAALLLLGRGSLDAALGAWRRSGSTSPARAISESRCLAAKASRAQ